MRYLILGTTDVLDLHGAPLPLGGARLRALLAALALRGGRTVSVRELVDDVYGDEPPLDAQAAVQALVGRLRRVLGKEAVGSGPGGYRLVAGHEDIDLYVFERRAREAGALLDAGDPEAAAGLYRSALALFRGPALADLPEPAGVRAEAQRLDALRRRIEADLRRGATTGLVPELTELTGAYAYDETFHAQLIRALRAEGRPADALAAYESARRTLADGLGTDPGPELTALHAELLAGEPPAPNLALTSNPALSPNPALTLTSNPAPASTPAPPTTPAPAPATPAPTPAAAPAGNIRPRLTSFVGREPDLAALRTELDRSRLVTLTGPGGSGKTRLAEEAALQMVGPAAWIAELAPLEASEDVPGAVLSALRLRETQLIARDGIPVQDDPTAQLVEHLSSRSLLLVLDNCEHVIDGAAALAETLLTHCPGLRVLATSREPLGVPGETVRPVEPLPATPAHRLFAERARAVRPGFRAEDDLPAVDEICRRLDGLPLAIELAAARLRLLTPRQIADRLDDRFRLLTSGSRTVLPRQQTLRAVVDWSWELLDTAERDLLRQVSVFAGGWDLAAAEALGRAAPGAPDTVGALGSLVEKSLVVAAPAEDGEMRYRLLETIHEYAAERAAETPELLVAAEAAHTAHFTAFAETADPLLRSGEQLPWIARIERDLDNIRAALHRTVVTAPDEAAAFRLVLAMGWFWWLRNYRPEAMTWVERILSLGEDPADPDDPRFWPRMQVRMLHFFLASESANAPSVRDDPEAAALVARVRAAFADDPGPQSARFPGMLWPLTSFLTDTPTDVRALLDLAVANCRRHGGPWEIGVALMFRTHMVVDMPGGMPGIDEDLAELRALSRRVGDRWMRAQVASAAGEANMMRGRLAEAREAYEEALAHAREVGAHAEAPFLLGRLAELDHRAGHRAAALKGLDEATAEADRYHVHDARTYVGFLRAEIALSEGDVVAARRHVETAGETIGAGTPPPHFEAAVHGLAARIEAHEGAGTPAVVHAVAALRLAVDAGSSEFVTTGLTEGVATALSLAGEPALALRLLGAVDGWRRGIPRGRPETDEAAALVERTAATLDAMARDTARASGHGLTLDEVLALLEPYTTKP
ncbi:BTAD domain-containing putative transcriptional regulator [Streptomyces sp. NPDC046275]|uniref:AfsR/SARP family transcriptional regulator n=1 Tax=Streptomyces sp. NPDC046275 TaxID=3157201 RepID=UPI0033FCD02E